MTRRPLTWLLAVVTLLLLVSPIAAQEVVDPKSLIGKWEGRWRELATAGPAYGSSGQFSLHITGASEKGVVGTYSSIGRGETTEGPFKGALQGNKLTFGRTELTIYGNKMEGTFRGPQTQRSIDLNKN